MKERLLPRIEPAITPEEVLPNNIIVREVNGVSYKIINVSVKTEKKEENDSNNNSPQSFV